MDIARYSAQIKMSREYVNLSHLGSLYKFEILNVYEWAAKEMRIVTLAFDGFTILEYIKEAV